MATYAIGDIHGCFAQLEQLLDVIKFNPEHDMLWCTGDLINGGPQPVEVLRLLRSLGSRAISVLGNHDLYFLAIAHAQQQEHHERGTGFGPILNAPDKQVLLDWLRYRPLVHFDAEFNTLLLHAGLIPQWDLTTAITRAQEVVDALHGPNFMEFLAHMYGNLPDTWESDLSGWERLRVIINVFTRIRYCTADGKLDLVEKKSPEHTPDGYLPWFMHPTRRAQDVNIIFGHWASLRGNVTVPNVYGLDTGCMWGGALTAMRLEDKQKFAVQNAN